MTGAVVVEPRGPVRGELAAPASKSLTNRMLVAAALAEGDSVLRNPLDSDDALAMRELVAAFGATVSPETDAWRVRGTGGHLAVPDAPVDARLSGTTLRFGAALATLAPGASTLTGGEPLLRRPVGPLLDALTALGADVYAEGGLPPVRVAGGGLDGGEVTVDVSGSSQFASALLLVGPYTRRGVRLRLSGLAADAYVELTASMMREFGATVGTPAARTWAVPPGVYRGGEHAIEYDASAAAHLLAFAVATGGRVTVTNAIPGSLQPDAAVTEVFAAMGATVHAGAGNVTVTGPERLRAVDADLSSTPDQVTTIAALVALAEGTSVIRGVAVARGHETDRLSALAMELGKLGVRVDELEGGLRIHGGTAGGPARLDTHDDHRLAMAFAALGARIPGVQIADPGCVAKTYPAFWEDVGRLGVRWGEVAPSAALS